MLEGQGTVTMDRPSAGLWSFWNIRSFETVKAYPHLRYVSLQGEDGPVQRMGKRIHEAGNGKGA